MAEIVPEFTIKEVESFHLHCIYKGKTKQRSVILKNARKICSTRKWKFYNILQKTSVWVMAENFCFNLQCIYKGKTKHRCDILKNAPKICSTRKWKFYNFLQETRIYELWWKSFPTLVSKKSMKEVESFCFHLHCIYKWKTKHRSKNLFNPQMKILQRFAKKRIWVSHGGNCSQF